MNSFYLRFFLFFIILSCSNIKKNTIIKNKCTQENAEKLAIEIIVKAFKNSNIDTLYSALDKSENDSTYNFYYCSDVLAKGGDIYISIYKKNCEINYKESFRGQ